MRKSQNSMRKSQSKKLRKHQYKKSKEFEKIGATSEKGVAVEEGKKDKLEEMRQYAKSLEDKDLRYELMFIIRAIQSARENNIKDEAFADKVFPDLAESSRLRQLYAMKGSTASGTPRRLKLSEALRMCRVIGEDFPTFAFRVQGALQLELDREAELS